MADLLSVEEALSRLLRSFNPKEMEYIPLGEAAGRVLAAPVSAGLDLPPFANSSMDGFAVRAADLAGAGQDSPVELPVVADVPAGITILAEIGPGQAARIMTGAPLPDGADAVIPVEDTDFNYRQPGLPVPETVKIFRSCQPGDHVRNRGEDVRRGEPVLPAGRRLRPQETGFLSMLGVAQVPVHRLPVVAIFSSGDELIPVDQPLHPGQIHDSNTVTLTALVQGAGARALNLGIAADLEEAVRETLDRAAEAGADLILSSAGVSVGAFDFVRSVVETGGSLDFWRVNMRPGKPLAFGNYRGNPFIGLPGNPVSAFVGFEVFVRPVLRRLAGERQPQRPGVQVRLLETVESDGRETYLRVVIERQDGELAARLAGHQGSGNLRSLVQANGLLIVPAGVRSLPAGSQATAWPLGEMPG